MKTRKRFALPLLATLIIATLTGCAAENQRPQSVPTLMKRR